MSPSPFTTLDPDAPFVLADGTEMIRVDGEWVEAGGDEESDDDNEGCLSVLVWLALGVGALALGIVERLA